MFLLFADLDNMKWINDTLAHQEGDLALIATSAILKQTFRDSDIFARIGGDEFVVLTTEVREDNADILSQRFQKNLDAYNELEKRPYTLMVSVGIARYEPENPCSIGELLSRADALMYEQKHKKGLTR